MNPHDTVHATLTQGNDQDIVDWIEGFYNRVRMHTSIGYQAPVAAELGRLAAFMLTGMTQPWR